MKQRTYAVTGMHCPSCEAIIEKRIRSLDGITGADASMSEGTVTLSAEGEPPEPETLCRLFPDGLYRFSTAPEIHRSPFETIRVAAYAAGVIALFFALSASGLLPRMTIDASSSAGAFLLFGLIAGLSTCAALVGSLVLALSTQWLNRQEKPATFTDKLHPQILFNTGRIAAFALTGAMLGLLGESVRISSEFTTVMVIAVSAVMLVVGLQMLGFSPVARLRFTLPKRFTNRLAGDGVTSHGMLRPLPTGFITILLPCGFTMAAEGAAILSGSPLHGMAIMTCFVLGTLPPLLFIGLSSAEFASRPATSRRFLKTAGMLVIFFTVYNLNSQFGIAGRIAERGTSIAVPKPAVSSEKTTIIRTSSSNGTLGTTRFDIRKGEKVRFIVDARDNGAGCMNAIMVPGLWNRAEYLVRNRPIIMEFTPVKPGTYPITCAMGMPWGVINVK